MMWQSLEVQGHLGVQTWAIQYNGREITAGKSCDDVLNTGCVSICSFLFFTVSSFDPDELCGHKGHRSHRGSGGADSGCCDRLEQVFVN